ncbi:hypothetical protein LEP1GSC193_1890 [Leptospira alstonii serovar Pingchang str. 80-412]|uniref:Uncharacterized protein n=2 Tax=Leptospira alstonii TaxID=28452 RepID=M6CUH1_9LEPT|nr:hypothetical protein LEP1GSC194_0862 [Leptospira alstonii serovar Sichuan str. 79601]EQA81400.1 hypothetical protein LEP1GSC193_1890 [Leptospira alstonii serovar Pingchang str. 80-412]
MYNITKKIDQTSVKVFITNKVFTLKRIFSLLQTCVLIF